MFFANMVLYKLNVLSVIVRHHHAEDNVWLVIIIMLFWFGVITFMLCYISCSVLEGYNGTIFAYGQVNIVFLLFRSTLAAYIINLSTVNLSIFICFYLGLS